MPNVEQWSQWGIAGMLVGVVVLAAWKLLDSVLKARDADLQWYRTEYAQKRQEYLASVDKLQKEYADRLKSIAEDFHHSVEAICERLEHLEQRLESVFRNLPNPRQ